MRRSKRLKGQREKIRKLWALGRSPNRHEAALALAKAQELERKTPPVAPAGCEYRQLKNGGGWGLFSRSAYNLPDYLLKNGKAVPGHVGHWRGYTAPPWRDGSTAPKRRAAEPPKEMQPFLFKQAQAIASYFAVEKLGLSNDRYSYQRTCVISSTDISIWMVSP
jgi:hypothetical protein